MIKLAMTEEGYKLTINSTVITTPDFTDTSLAYLCRRASYYLDILLTVEKAKELLEENNGDVELGK